VKTRKLTRDESIDFLEKGFAQIGVKPEKSMLEEIVYTLDGVIGWLTYVGAEVTDPPTKTRENVPQCHPPTGSSPLRAL